MRIESFGISDIGRRRPRNEDRLLVDDSLGLYVVCDGMGGHAGGDVAADIAVRAVAEFLRDRRTLIECLEDDQNGQTLATQMVEQAVQEAHRRVRDLAEKTASLSGMGTTLTLLLVVGRWAVSAHLGDSRLYRVRSGKVEQLTDDHTLAAQFVGRDTTGLEHLLRRYRHALVRWVGNSEKIQPDVRIVHLQIGDCLVLCTDGLSKYLDKANELTTLACSWSPRRSARELIRWANEQGGSDNITAIVLHLCSDTFVTEPASTVVQAHAPSDSSASYCLSLR